jgi:hypothetical protein
MESSDDVPAQSTLAGRLGSVIGSVLVALAVAVGVVIAQNVALQAYFPHLTRLTTDFSPEYLKRELYSIAAPPRAQTIFFGDSVLWGYRLQADQTAISILARNGCACRNLAFKSGSAPNYYALARLFAAIGVHPKVVVIEVNQRAFNPMDNAYRALHPAIAVLADPLLTPVDRATLGLPPAKVGLGGQLDRAFARLSALYAMRSDIRETLYGDDIGAPLPHPSAALFDGAYDLTPLSEKNVGVRYLEKTADLLRRAGIPVIAFMTPTNHALLRDLIDTPEYTENGVYLRRLLERRGARVLDLDTAFPGQDFFDNAHLRPAGQQRLAAILQKALVNYR